ncbi:GNAT family N-acetyltransferase [Nakamurella sp. GG22]
MEFVEDRFVLLPGAPRLVEYQRLRAHAGLPGKSHGQAVGALRGSWAICHIRAPGGGAVAMGRVIGDGGWYFTIADLATSPAYQGRGLGSRVLGWLLTQIDARAPADPYVTLLADPPARDLCERAGFRVLGRHGSAVHMVLDPDPT